MKVRFANKIETKNIILMRGVEKKVIDPHDKRDITLTDLELIEAEKDKNHYVQVLLRNYHIVRSNPYKESLHASKNELLQLNDLICKTIKVVDKKGLFEAKKKCIETIDKLEKLCATTEEREYFAEKGMTDAELTQRMKHNI